MQAKRKFIEDLSISMYCQICNFYDICEKSKSCSCDKFETNDEIGIHHNK